MCKSKNNCSLEDFRSKQLEVICQPGEREGGAEFPPLLVPLPMANDEREGRKPNNIYIYNIITIIIIVVSN